MPFRIRLAASAGACILAFAGAAAAQDPAADAGASAEVRALGQACGWLGPLDLEVMRLVGDEQLGFVEAQGGVEARAAAATAAEARAEAIRATPCAGDQADAVKPQVQTIAQSQRNRLLMRATAFTIMPQPWAADLTTAGDSRKELHIGASGLKAAAEAEGKGELFKGLAAQTEGEARAAALIVCSERKAVRAAEGERACPPIPPQDQAMAPYARAMVASVEAFAPLYAEAVRAELTAAAAKPAEAPAP